MANSGENRNDGPAPGTEGEGGAEKTVKVRFKNAYMGTLGNYRAGAVYDLPVKVYAVLKADCEKVKQ